VFAIENSTAPATAIPDGSSVQRRAGCRNFLLGPGARAASSATRLSAGFTLKNGVSINYIEGISLFDWMEIGFNTFPAYRDGETAWIYAQTLRLLRQLHGVKAIFDLSISDRRRQ